MYFSFLPVKIAYDSTDNLYYVLSIGKKNSDIRSYRIDRIIHLEPVNGISDYSPDLSFLMQIAPNVWGCNFSAVSDPKNLFHVKVRFFNVANVFNKVRKELSCRTNGQLYEKDGFLYYEDDRTGTRSSAHTNYHFPKRSSLIYSSLYFFRSWLILLSVYPSSAASSDIFLFPIFSLKKLSLYFSVYSFLGNEI